MTQIHVITTVPRGRHAAKGRQLAAESPASGQQQPTGRHRKLEPQVVDNELVLPGATWRAR
jgi:hypothetical protein